MSYNKADKFMIEEFIISSKNVLKKYDQIIYENLLRKKGDSFYKNDWKGLGTRGITETTIKFFIYIELCNKYYIWPERQYDDGSKCRADLTIYLDPKKYEIDYPPEIAIEMKWGGIRNRKKPGSLNQWSIDHLETELEKLRDHSESPNNYVLQIVFTPKDIEINENQLQNQVNNELSGYLTRYHKIKLLTMENFKSHSENLEKKDIKIWLLCWKLN